MRDLAEYKERQEGADKRRDCVVGARSRRPERPLSRDVKVYAESVGDKPDQQHCRYRPEFRYAFPDRKTDKERACTGKNTFDHNYLNRIL